MSRLLKPLRQETLEPLVHDALKAISNAETAAAAIDLFRQLLVFIQECNQIKIDNRTLLPFVEQLASVKTLEKLVASFEKVDWFHGQILREYYINGKSDQKLSAQINYGRAHTQRLRLGCITDFCRAIVSLENQARQQLRKDLINALPQASYRMLLGRDTASAELLDALVANEAKPICIFGLGGIGKTSLTHHAVTQFISDLEVDRLIWLRLDEQVAGDSVDTLYRQLAQQIDPDKSAGLDSDQVITFVKTRLEDIPHLVIIDNIESRPQLATALDCFYTKLGDSRIVLTSRVKPAEGKARTITLGDLHKSTARELFETTRRSVSKETLSDSLIASVLHQTGGHPLAIRLAATLTEDELRTFSTSPALTSVNNVDFFENLFMQKWQQLNNEARLLMLALPLLPPNGVTRAGFIELTQLQKRTFWPAIDQMEAHSLVDAMQLESGETRYGAHQLVTEFAKRTGANAVDPQDPYYSPRDVFSKLLTNNIDVWRKRVESTFLLSQFTKHEMQLQKLVRFGLGDSSAASGAVSILRALRLHVDNRGSHDAWIPLFERALKVDCAADLPVQFQLLRHTGMLYRTSGQKYKATDFLHEAQNIAEELLQDETLIMQSDFEMAWLKLGHSQLKESLFHAERSLKIRKKMRLGPAAELPVYQLIAEISRLRGNFDAALQHFKRAVKCANATDSLHEKARLHHLEMMLHGMIGDVGAAQEAYARTLDCIAQSGLRTLSVKLHMSMANIYHDHNQVASAQSELTTAESIGRQRPMSLFERCYVDLQWARFHIARNEWHEARPRLEDHLQTLHDIDEPLSLAEAMLCLSNVLRHLGQPSDADRLQQEGTQLLRVYGDFFRAKKLLGSSGFLPSI